MKSNGGERRSKHVDGMENYCVQIATNQDYTCRHLITKQQQLLVILLIVAEQKKAEKK